MQNFYEENFNDANNNDNILCDSMHNLFNATARGVTYWRKHRYHICYKCRRYGHISYDCDKICNLCNNLHTGTVCIFSIMKLYRKINRKLKGSIIRDPEEIIKFVKSTQEKIFIETGEKTLEDYYQKIAKKPKRYNELSITQPCRLNYPRKKKTLQDINREIREEMEKKGNSKLEVVTKIQQQRRDKIDELFAELDRDKKQKEVKQTPSGPVKKFKKKVCKKIDDRPANKKQVSIRTIQDLNNLLLNTTIDREENIQVKNNKDSTLENTQLSSQNMKLEKCNTREASDLHKTENKSYNVSTSETSTVEQKRTPLFQVRNNEIELKTKKVDLDLIDKLQKQLDKAKTRLMNTKHWITDLQYFKSTKRDLEKMEEKWSKLNNKSERVKKKIEEQYAKLKSKKEEFYKKKDEFYNFKEEVYKRMRNDNEKAREKVHHKFKQARKKKHITEISGMYRRAQQIGYRGSFKKFKDDYFRNPKYFDEKYFPEKNWR